VSRLRDFGGGFVPPSVAREIEFRRRQRGLSQRDLGKLIGRSQGQLANALRGHDPVSAFVVNRLRDVLLGGVSGRLRHVSDDRCASVAAGQGDAFLSN
jgi:predicted transcriptional regulator